MDTSLEQKLREVIREVVREELAVERERERAERGGEWLTTQEAASLAKLEVGTVRDWVKRGKLEAKKLGRRIRVSRSALEAAMELPRRRSQELAPDAWARSALAGRRR